MIPVAVAMMLDAAARLELKGQADVAGPYVPLLAVVDAREVPADLYAALESVYLGAAPEGDRIRVIDAEEIRRVLRRRGVEAVEIVGERVEVRRAAETGAATLREMLRAELEAEALRLALEASGEPPDRLAAEILAAGLEEMPAEARLAEMTRRSSEVFGSRTYAYRLQYADGTSTWHTAMIRVSRVVEAAFAARRLSPGRVLRPEDVEIRPVRTDGSVRYLESDQAVGGRTLSALEAGEPLTHEVARTRPVVRRNESVSVDGGVFQSQARAREDGAVGDTIQVEYAATQSVATVRVTGPGRVEVIR